MMWVSTKCCDQVWTCTLERLLLSRHAHVLTFARGTMPFSLVAATSYSGANLLQWPHLWVQQWEQNVFSLCYKKSQPQGVPCSQALIACCETTPLILLKKPHLSPPQWRLGLGPTTWYLCLSQWSQRQIRQSKCHEFLPYVDWTTANSTRLTLTNPHSFLCTSSGRTWLSTSWLSSLMTCRETNEDWSGSIMATARNVEEH